MAKFLRYTRELSLENINLLGNIENGITEKYNCYINDDFGDDFLDEQKLPCEEKEARKNDLKEILDIIDECKIIIKELKELELSNDKTLYNKTKTRAANIVNTVKNLITFYQVMYSEDIDELIERQEEEENLRMWAFEECVTEKSMSEALPLFDESYKRSKNFEAWLEEYDVF